MSELEINPNGLKKFIERGHRLKESEVPKEISNDVIEKEITPPSICPECGSQGKVYEDAENEEDEFLFKCYESNDLKTISAETRKRYKLNFEDIFERLSEYLGYDKSSLKSEEKLPNYIESEIAENVDLTLICDQKAYKNTIKELVDRSVREERIKLVLTPRDKIEEIFNIIETFAVTSFFHPFPIEKLEEKELMLDAVKMSENTRKIIEDTRDKRGLEGKELIRRADKNPALIASTLLYLRTLRSTNEISETDGSPLENACSAAFQRIANVKPNFGGEDNTDQSVPDLLSRLPSNSNYKQLFLVIDAKSGDTAKFGKEEVKAKHEDYVGAFLENENYEGKHMSHVFTVFNFDGHQELKFYDKMEEYYDKNRCTLSIIKTSALAMMLLAYDSIILKNEIELSEGEFTELIRPFFDKEAFNNELKSETKNLTRFENMPEYPEHLKEKYRENLRPQERLIIVTPEMVKNRIENAIEGKGSLEHLFDAYGL
ncbi:MAG: hypothetical protein ABEJ98_00565 [Candidatus Nanohaloarchaea archaeon]